MRRASERAFYSLLMNNPPPPPFSQTRTPTRCADSSGPMTGSFLHRVAMTIRFAFGPLQHSRALRPRATLTTTPARTLQSRCIASRSTARP